MSLLARGLALQGFLLNPIAMAVQGLLAGGEIVVPEPTPEPIRRRASQAGRGASISLSDYIKAQNRRNAFHAIDAMLLNQEQEKKRRTLRQRKQHRIAALAVAALSE